MLLDGMLVILSTLSTMTLSCMIGVQSQEYKPVIQPSNGAFSIWGIIFISLLVSGIFLCYSGNEIIPSTFCAVSLLLCNVWLFVAGTRIAVYILGVSCICAACASVIYANISEYTIILLGPNLLFSWLTIATLLSSISHLRIYKGIMENMWMPLPFFLFHIAISITTVILGRYESAIFISIPITWTVLYSKHPIDLLFLTISCVELIYILADAFCINEII